MKFKAKNNVIIAGHRGDICGMGQNTIKSFQSAIDKGVDMIETDVRISKDGELVLLHEYDVDLTTNGTGMIADMTLQEIKSLTSGDPEKQMQIATFKEFLELVAPFKHLYLDIELKVWKDEGPALEVADRVVAMCEEYGVCDRVLFNSVDAYVLEHIYKQHGNKFLYHGFYPFHTQMRNITIPPEEYLTYAFIWGATGEDAKRACEDLLSKGILPCSGCATQEKDFYEVASYGCAMFTENDPETALRWRENLTTK